MNKCPTPLKPELLCSIALSPEERNDQDAKIIFEELDKLGLFDNFFIDKNESYILDICHNAIYESHESNDILFCRGELARCWYILISGSVKINDSVYNPFNWIGAEDLPLRVNECQIVEPSEFLVMKNEFKYLIPQIETSNSSILNYKNNLPENTTSQSLLTSPDSTFDKTITSLKANQENFTTEQSYMVSGTENQSIGPDMTNKWNNSEDCTQIQDSANYSDPVDYFDSQLLCEGSSWEDIDITTNTESFQIFRKCLECHPSQRTEGDMIHMRTCLDKGMLSRDLNVLKTSEYNLVGHTFALLADTIFACFLRYCCLPTIPINKQQSFSKSTMRDIDLQSIFQEMELRTYSNDLLNNCKRTAIPLIDLYGAFVADVCSLAILAEIPDSDVLVLSQGEQLDSWCIVCTGHISVHYNHGVHKTEEIILNPGDYFGVRPTTKIQYFDGIMRTRSNFCSFICISQIDFHTLITQYAEMVETQCFLELKSIFQQCPNKLILSSRDNGNDLILSSLIVEGDEEISSHGSSCMEDYNIQLDLECNDIGDDKLRLTPPLPHTEYDDNRFSLLSDDSISRDSKLFNYPDISGEDDIPSSPPTSDINSLAPGSIDGHLLERVGAYGNRRNFLHSFDDIFDDSFTFDPKTADFEYDYPPTEQSSKTDLIFDKLGVTSTTPTTAAILSNCIQVKQGTIHDLVEYLICDNCIPPYTLPSSKSGSINQDPFHAKSSALLHNNYIEDFLLTYRVFLKPLFLASKLLTWFHQNSELREKATKILLLWVNNHYGDFETIPKMTEFLEYFEILLEKEKMQGQLTLLNMACFTKARNRNLTLTRSMKDDCLHFSILGGWERQSPIYVSKVERGSKAYDLGLKRGDQILEVNGQNFEYISHSRALDVFRNSTHLSVTVKSNILGFKQFLSVCSNSPPRLYVSHNKDDSFIDTQLVGLVDGTSINNTNGNKINNSNLHQRYLKLPLKVDSNIFIAIKKQANSRKINTSLNTSFNSELVDCKAANVTTLPPKNKITALWKDNKAKFKKALNNKPEILNVTNNPCEYGFSNSVIKPPAYANLNRDVPDFNYSPRHSNLNGEDDIKYNQTDSSVCKQSVLSLHPPINNSSTLHSKARSQNKETSLPSPPTTRTSKLSTKPILISSHTLTPAELLLNAATTNISTAGLSSSNSTTGATTSYPENVIKVYRGPNDPAYKFLLIHKETTSKEVVMLALREFGISDPSNMYSLLEVSVQNGGVLKRKRLPEHLNNLTDRMDLTSRYYIKKNLQSLLIQSSNSNKHTSFNPSDTIDHTGAGISGINGSESSLDKTLADELIEESGLTVQNQGLNNECYQIDLLSLKCYELALQLTLRDFDLFRKIESSEYVNDLFKLPPPTPDPDNLMAGNKDCDHETNLEFSLGDISTAPPSSFYAAAHLKYFEKLVDAEMFWVINEIVVKEPKSLVRRFRKLKYFLKLATLCRNLNNFNTAFAICSGLTHSSVSRLEITWSKLPAKYKLIYDDLLELMNPSRNMFNYRNQLNRAKKHPPVIPFFPLLKKDVTFLHLGNETYLSELKPSSPPPTPRDECSMNSCLTADRIVVNFEKMHMISRQLHGIQNMCSIPLDFKRVLDSYGPDSVSSMKNMYKHWPALFMENEYDKDDDNDNLKITQGYNLNSNNSESNGNVGMGIKEPLPHKRFSLRQEINLVGGEDTAQQQIFNSTNKEDVDACRSKASSNSYLDFGCGQPSPRNEIPDDVRNKKKSGLLHPTSAHSFSNLLIQNVKKWREDVMKTTNKVDDRRRSRACNSANIARKKHSVSKLRSSIPKCGGPTLQPSYSSRAPSVTDSIQSNDISSSHHNSPSANASISSLMRRFSAGSESLAREFRKNFISSQNPATPNTSKLVEDDLPNKPNESEEGDVFNTTFSHFSYPSTVVHKQDTCCERISQNSKSSPVSAGFNSLKRIPKNKLFAKTSTDQGQLVSSNLSLSKNEPVSSFTKIPIPPINTSHQDFPGSTNKTIDFSAFTSTLGRLGSKWQNMKNNEQMGGTTSSTSKTQDFNIFLRTLSTPPSPKGAKFLPNSTLVNIPFQDTMNPPNPKKLYEQTHAVRRVRTYLQNVFTSTTITEFNPNHATPFTTATSSQSTLKQSNLNSNTTNTTTTITQLITNEDALMKMSHLCEEPTNAYKIPASDMVDSNLPPSEASAEHKKGAEAIGKNRLFLKTISHNVLNGGKHAALRLNVPTAQKSKLAIVLPSNNNKSEAARRNQRLASLRATQQRNAELAAKTQNVSLDNNGTAVSFEYQQSHQGDLLNQKLHGNKNKKTLSPANLVNNARLKLKHKQIEDSSNKATRGLLSNFVVTKLPAIPRVVNLVANSDDQLLPCTRVTVHNSHLKFGPYPANTTSPTKYHQRNPRFATQFVCDVGEEANSKLMSLSQGTKYKGLTALKSPSILPKQQTNLIYPPSHTSYYCNNNTNNSAQTTYPPDMPCSYGNRTITSKYQSISHVPTLNNYIDSCSSNLPIIQRSNFNISSPTSNSLDSEMVPHARSVSIDLNHVINFSDKNITSLQHGGSQSYRYIPHSTTTNMSHQFYTKIDFNLSKSPSIDTPISESNYGLAATFSRITNNDNGNEFDIVTSKIDFGQRNYNYQSSLTNCSTSSSRNFFTSGDSGRGSSELSSKHNSLYDPNVKSIPLTPTQQHSLIYYNLDSVHLGSGDQLSSAYPPRDYDTTPPTILSPNFNYHDGIAYKCSTSFSTTNSIVRDESSNVDHHVGEDGTSFNNSTMTRTSCSRYQNNSLPQQTMPLLLNTLNQPHRDNYDIILHPKLTIPSSPPPPYRIRHLPYKTVDIDIKESSDVT